MTVGELAGRLSAAELAEWMAYDRIDPIGPERADLAAAIVAATVANAQRGRGQPPFRPADFMPRFERADLAQSLRAAFAALGDADDRDRGTER